MGFQTRINADLPLAVEGDFASANPITSVIAGEAALVAGPLGLTVGRFAWRQADRHIASNVAFGANMPDGFVHREMQASYYTYLTSQAGMVISPGQQITLHNEGDFFARVAGAVAAVDKMQAFANFADGTVSFGSAPVGASATGSIGATFTATGTATTLVVSNVTGVISVGDTLSGTGVPAGTTILSQQNATTFITSNPTTAAASTVTSFGNVLNVTAVGSGLLTPGVSVTGTGVPASTSIISQSSGATGGTGLYTISNPATAYAASTALTTVGGIATNFYARSNAAVGELVKISTWGKL